MKSVKVLQVTLISLFSISALATGRLDPQLRNEIEKVCVERAKKNKNTAKVESLCMCIAAKHFESALKEPSTKEARNQLHWVIDYYSADEKKAKVVAARLPYMTEFDLSIIDE